MPAMDLPIRTEEEFENTLAEVFRKAGWRVRRHPKAGDMQADLAIEAGEQKYVVEIKGLSEGRRDRLIPLLSQAILQAQAFARSFHESAMPLAVVVARRIPASVVEHVRRFARRYAPSVGIGIVDLEGLRAFVGPGLEGLDATPPRSVSDHIAASRHVPDLFSDLNQWMLKILLGQRLPESLISVPRQQIRNASQLATAANVSMMSAFRLLSQLAHQGFLNEGDERLEVVRVEELLERWLAASREAVRDLPARWVLKKGRDQLQSALREYSSLPLRDSDSSHKPRSRQIIRHLPRCCLGLFSAAEALRLAFVHGAPPYIYLERLNLDSLGRLGLALDHSDRPADVYIRVPTNREAIFRASVISEGIPVTDVLQVWLDVSTHPARGREQAAAIQRRVLKQLIGR